jgi:hypothetical protein
MTEETNLKRLDHNWLEQFNIRGEGRLVSVRALLDHAAACGGRRRSSRSGRFQAGEETAIVAREAALVQANAGIRCDRRRRDGRLLLAKQTTKKLQQGAGSQ